MIKTPSNGKFMISYIEERHTCMYGSNKKGVVTEKLVQGAEIFRASEMHATRELS
jgi:hypothetical protein